MQRGGFALEDLTWLVLGMVVLGLGLLVALILVRMSGEQDREARHDEKELNPYSDVTITQFGNY